MISCGIGPNEICCFVYSISLCRSIQLLSHLFHFFVGINAYTVASISVSVALEPTATVIQCLRCFYVKCNHCFGIAYPPLHRCVIQNVQHLPPSFGKGLETYCCSVDSACHAPCQLVGNAMLYLSMLKLLNFCIRLYVYKLKKKLFIANRSICLLTETLLSQNWNSWRLPSRPFRRPLNSIFMRLSIAVYIYIEAYRYTRVRCRYCLLSCSFVLCSKKGSGSQNALKHRSQSAL